MQEKLRELIAHCKNTGMTNGKWFAGELEAALAASEPAPQPGQIIEIDEDGKVHYPPCACFTCSQHGPLLKAIEQRESLAREHK